MRLGWWMGWGALCLLGLGCGDKGSGGDDSGGGEEADADTDTDADTDADTDVDTSNLGPDPGCEGYDGTPIAGATGFFVGSFSVDGELAVTGTERWVLFANSRWQELGGGDCEVVWNLTGLQGDATGACGACAYSLELGAILDTQATTCPADLYAGDESFSVVYNVLVAGDAATFYFESGSDVGQGTQGTSSMSYISEGSCLYF